MERELQLIACSWAEVTSSALGLTLRPQSRGAQVEPKGVATPRRLQTPRRPPCETPLPMGPRVDLGSVLRRTDTGPEPATGSSQADLGQRGWHFGPQFLGQIPPQFCQSGETEAELGDPHAASLSSAPLKLCVCVRGRLLATFEILGPDASGARPLLCAGLTLLASESLEGPNQKERERAGSSLSCKSLSR